MAVTDDFSLPTEKQLTVPEVELSGVVLRAGAFHLGKYCENVNNEFMLCRNETDDVRLCLGEGKAVTKCTLNFFSKVKESCAEEFKKHYKCIDRSSATYSYSYCRKTQKVFDKCMLDNLSLPRPDYGYFCQVKIHEAFRPKPPEEPIMVFEASDLPQKLPDDYERHEAKYGLRKTLGG